MSFVALLWLKNYFCFCWWSFSRWIFYRIRL